ncbi:MAG TPA: phosphoribosyltransferase family protein, partial [Acidobacteriota bacterium]|nr:phosphoribosyltransferase family protein [Acidobacteriota bacterium]
MSEFNQPNLKVLIDRAQIQARIQQLGDQITNDYRGKPLALISVLKGASLFTADLMRCVDLPVTVDFIAVSSYGAAAKSSGEVRILKDLDTSLKGRDVLVVEVSGKHTLASL